MERFRVCGLLALVVAGGPAAAQQSAGATYEIDAERSDIHWLIYRAGAFSRLGHNHVISVGSLVGTIYLSVDPSQSRFEMEIPVADLIVDDPDLRRRSGADFATEPSAEDIAATRRNMLGEDVLDVDQFPLLRVSGRNWQRSTDAESVDLTIRMLGRAFEMTVPTSVVIDGDTLVATGSFSLTHRMLGMRPFRVMLGTVRVADEMDFVYEIRAERSL